MSTDLLLYPSSMDDPAATRDDTAAVLAALLRLDERLTRIEQRLAQVEAVGPAALAMAVDSVDDAARRLAERGVDIGERTMHALQLLERVTQRDTTRFLTQLLDLAESAPATLALLTDALDERLTRLSDRGVDLDERTAGVGRLLEVFTRPALLAWGLRAAEALERPELGELLGHLERALSESHNRPVTPVGVLGLLRALSDGDVQRSLGFALAMARSFGRGVREMTALAYLTPGSRHD